MVKNMIIVLCVVVAFPAFSQNTIDSLKALLPSSVNGVRADILFELGYQSYNVDNILAHRYSRESFAIAKNMNDSSRTLRAGRVLAPVLRELGKVDSATLIFEHVLLLAEIEKDSAALRGILNSYGLVLTVKGEYDKALKCHYRALEISRLKKDSVFVVANLNNIGMIHYKLKDYKKASEYFGECIGFSEGMKKPYLWDVALSNQSLCYSYLGDFSKAKLFANKSLGACGPECPTAKMGNISFAYGILYHGLKEYSVAEKYFLISLACAEKVNDVRFIFDNIDYLSEMYMRQKKLEQALNFLNKAQRLITQGASHKLELIKIYYRFSQLYTKTKNFEKASSYQQRYMELKDSVYSEALTTNLMKVQAAHLEKENEAKIVYQDQILALNEKVIVGQRLLNMMIGGLAIMLIALVLLLIRSNRRKQWINQLLEEKVKERTRALEESYNGLLGTINARDQVIENKAKDVNRVMTTLKSICAVGLKDIQDPLARRYIEELAKTTETLNKKFALTESL
jgi:tetratricopeptide (TPR) repeat protein